ncbi:MAG: hypothetical protein K2X81_16610 [Candidatus Obscuribacterales bacterium]|nr:hypothetical protein [Candidatus Obscuribacterales bacterium]
MTTRSRKELLAALRPLYAQVTWKEKQRVLDGFVAATGYNRKHATVLLNRKTEENGAAWVRSRKYDEDVEVALIQVWKASNRICSKRLIPFLPTMINSLEKFGHLNISSTTRTKLLTLSRSSADRLLKNERKQYAKRKSTTKPGYLLKKHIPIRTYSDWNDVRPGFFEADLVAHGGSSASGQFPQTLTMTDIASGWTECSALLCKSEFSVLRAFELIKQLLPFPLLGLDTDNLVSSLTMVYWTGALTIASHSLVHESIRKTTKRTLRKRMDLLCDGWSATTDLKVRCLCSCFLNSTE